MTVENVDRVIAAATHKTKRVVEELVAALRPQPPVPSSVRKLPQATRDPRPPKTAAVHTDLPVGSREPVAPHTVDGMVDASAGAGADVPVQPVPRPVTKPLAPEQYLVKFTASRAMHEKLREAQALLRHQVPTGDVAEIFDRALTLLLADLRKARCAATSRPRSLHRTSKTGRHVAAAVKRDVWARDGGQCAFVGAAGRCTERGFLEYHHVIPFGDGGATDVSNLQLRCRAHNGFEAQRWSGPGEEDFLREVSPFYGDGLLLVAVGFRSVGSIRRMPVDSVQDRVERFGRHESESAVGETRRIFSLDHIKRPTSACISRGLR